ncbi:transmembrane protein 272-like [Gigantopelta aegis]|uniref:transmembrane protein 272-like n=1 Tax=Gigantopelta aegis TaxID=1735272 RepID=UPI001B88A9F5|nr:transmembrane protein 272-like [Gigantopelta aegis]
MASNAEKGYQQDDVPPPYSQDVHSSDVPLPSYNQSVINTADPPPSYDSLFGRVKQVRGESSSNVDFMKKFIFLLLGTVGCTICIGLVMAIPVSMIVMGAVYLHDCPAERYIPIYLVVMGCFGVFKNLLSLGQRAKNRNEETNEEEGGGGKKKTCLESVLGAFMFAWFIAGNVWIYRLYGDYDGFDITKSNYCYNTLYLYAFWMTTATYILILTVCCCTCFGTLLASCLKP